MINFNIDINIHKNNKFNNLGNQTLGEEYCEIIPINNATKTPPSKLVCIYIIFKL